MSVSCCVRVRGYMTKAAVCKGVLGDAGFICKEASLYGRGNGKNAVGFNSWQEVERFSAKHGGSFGTSGIQTA